MQRDILPCDTKRIENPPRCRKSGERIVQQGDAWPAQTASLHLPKHSKVRHGDSGNQHVAKMLFPLAARVITYQDERQEDHRRLFRQQRKRETDQRGDLLVPEVQDPRRNQESCGKQFGASHDGRDRLGMDGMHGKDQGRCKRHGLRLR